MGTKGTAVNAGNDTRRGLTRQQLRERRERYFRLVAGGMASAEACRVVGVSKRTGKVWRNGRTRATGRSEMPVLPYVRMEQNTDVRVTGRHNVPTSTYGSSGKYLTLDDRILLADLVRQGCSVREMARRIDRPASTVSRELRRCSGADERSSGSTGGGRDGNGTRGNSTAARNGYNPFLAHKSFVERMARPRQRKLLVCKELREYVQAKLALHWSPEQISNRLRVDFPYTESMRVSHETIYQSIYVQGKGALRRELVAALRTGRAARKPKRTSGARRGRQFKDPMVNISERPAEAADRAVPGHWEGDLIVGEKHSSAIGTLVERTSRFTLLLHLPGDHTAETVRDAIVHAMGQLPTLLQRSLTWDQGVELALHRQIAETTGLDVFFCDPHSPWQRGTNENTNGLLRQYFPKGTDLSVHTPTVLAHVATELNGRPRKTLSWLTPAEKLAEILQADVE